MEFLVLSCYHLWCICVKYFCRESFGRFSKTKMVTRESFGQF